jgi:hypothetical protein
VGNENPRKLHLGKKQSAGKALLETNELIFRPSDGSPRLKIPFSTIKSAQAVGGELLLETAVGPISFTLGQTAEKWCQKILHPKTRAEKLGLKPETQVSLLGGFDPEFLKELRAATRNISEDKVNPAGDLIFLSVDSTKQLTTQIAKTTRTIKGATALWIVYPKGKTEITENEVISAGRKSGLKDVKVVGFSPTHTALKFVLPLSSR